MRLGDYLIIFYFYIIMGKLRVGHKENSFLNGEWAGHVRAWGKKFTAKKRRNVDKKVIKNDLKNEL